MGSIAAARLSREILLLQRDPPPGAFCAPINDTLTEFEAQIQGPAGTVYEGGVFKLAIDIPTRYPMEPPKVRFTTPVYHPNIDPEGRICLDILNAPPKGAWKPSLNLSTVLASIGLLLADPNPDDGLVTETTQEFKHQRDVFDSKARAWTRQHAMQQVVGPSTATEATPDKAPFAEAEHSGQLDRQQDQEAGTVLQTQLRGAEEEGPKERGDVLGSANGGTLPDAGWKRGREAHGEDKEDRPPGMSVSAPAAHGAQEGALQAPCEQPKRSKLSLRR